jgi:hypothetical protein
VPADLVNTEVDIDLPRGGQGRSLNAESIMRIRSFPFALILAVGASTAGISAETHPPRIVPGGPKTRPVQLPDGSLRAYFSRFGKLFSVSARDPARWSEPKAELELPHKNMGGGLSFVDADGEVHVILTHGRGTGRPAETRFIDLWHCRTFEGRKRWSTPQRIWEGYCGAVMDVKQLKSGRIVVPFAAWKKPGETVAPSSGSNYTTVVVSDDGGRTWRLSPTKLTSPCREGYNGNNYGAIEPTILELNDGRVWMLMRTQTGFLYESFSKDGLDWSAAKPSRFHSSTSPAALIRLADGRIVVVWNNCEQPPRYQGQGVYGGRDALHAAISSDEGKTWRGFREIYRDPHRDETPPQSGDRGTAYPGGVATREGTLLVASGQGDRRNLIVVDPDWLTETTQETSFEKGLSDWHVWKPFGPARGYWRDRTLGPQLIEDPARRGRKVLHVRRPERSDPDCAAWNFPAGTKGMLRLRLLVRKGSPGVSLALANRFFNPADERGERDAPVLFRLAAEREDGDVITVSADEWHTLSVSWDAAKGRATAAIDGKRVAQTAIRERPFGGVSYLRLRSRAGSTDTAGVLIESVEVETNNEKTR